MAAPGSFLDFLKHSFFKGCSKYDSSWKLMSFLHCPCSYTDIGWYRFTGPQGGDMVREPVDPGSCGTAYSIWMNGTSCLQTHIYFQTFGFTTVVRLNVFNSMAEPHSSIASMYRRQAIFRAWTTVWWTGRRARSAAQSRAHVATPSK